MKKILSDALNRPNIDINKVCNIIREGQQVKIAGFIPWRTQALGVFEPLDEKYINILHYLLDKIDEVSFHQFFTQIVTLLEDKDFKSRENIPLEHEAYLASLINAKSTNYDSLINKTIKLAYLNTVKQLIKAGGVIRHVSEEHIQSILNIGFQKQDIEFFQLLCFGKGVNFYNTILKSNHSESKNYHVLENYFDHIVNYISSEQGKNNSSVNEIFQLILVSYWSNKHFLDQDAIKAVLTPEVVKKFIQRLIEVEQSNFDGDKLIAIKVILKDITQQTLNLLQTYSIIPNSQKENQHTVVAQTVKEGKISEATIVPSKLENSLPNLIEIDHSKILKAQEISLTLKENFEKDKRLKNYAISELGHTYSTLHLMELIKATNLGYFQKQLAKIDQTKSFGQANDFFKHYIKGLDSQEFSKTTKSDNQKSFNVYELAVIYNDLESIKILLEDSNYYNRNNPSLMDFVINNNRPEILKYLLEDGGMLNVDWSYVMFTACKYGSSQIIDNYSLRFKDDILLSTNSNGLTIFNYLLKGIGDLLKSIRATHKGAFREDSDTRTKASSNIINKLKEADKCFKILFQDNPSCFTNEKDLEISLFHIQRIAKYAKYYKTYADAIIKWGVHYLLQFDDIPLNISLRLNDFSEDWETSSQTTATTACSHASMLSDIMDEPIEPPNEPSYIMGALTQKNLSALQDY